MTPSIEAHRGDNANAPGNTLSAFKRAVELSVPWIELDVRPSKEGELMVIHDSTVDRTTDGSGAVSDLTVEDLRQLDAGAKFSPAYAGEKIPHLIDVLEMVEPKATRLNVEIKSFPPGNHTPENVAKILRMFGKQQEYVVSSFNLDSLLRIRAVAPEIPLALIGNATEILPTAEAYSLPWIHGEYTTMTEEIVNAAHRQDICVSVWSVDDSQQYPHWKRMGVDKLCTNRPTEMLSQAG